MLLSIRSLSVVVAMAVVRWAAIGCGARSALIDDEEGGGGSELGCLLPEAVRDVVSDYDETTCALEGQSADGRTHRMLCAVADAAASAEFIGCWWSTDGDVTCEECDRPGWTMTCPNGVPLCVGWNQPFDFANDVDDED